MPCVHFLSFLLSCLLCGSYSDILFLFLSLPPIVEQGTTTVFALQFPYRSFHYPCIIGVMTMGKDFDVLGFSICLSVASQELANMFELLCYVVIF